MAQMIAAALVEQGCSEKHIFCDVKKLSALIADAQMASTNGWAFTSKSQQTKLALRPTGAAEIAKAIRAEEFVGIHAGHFDPIVAKLVIMHGDYQGKEKQRAADLNFLTKGLQGKGSDRLFRWAASTEQASYVAQHEGCKGLFDNKQLNSERFNAFFEALGTGDASQYKAALGESFKEAPKTEQGNFKTPQNSAFAHEENKRQGMSKATTAMGMTGLAGVALWGLLTKEKTTTQEVGADGQPVQKETEKSFWAQPRKYLAIAALVGASIWGLKIYNQSKGVGLER
jgi:hypothetical protein